MAQTRTRQPEPALRIDAGAAHAIADDFLIMQVGDLLEAGPPTLRGGKWLMEISLSNATRGRLGVVGQIGVDSASGDVFFPDEERAKVEVRAWELTRASAR